MVKRKSRSGRHKNPGVLLRASAAELAAWREQAKRAQLTLTAWIRRAVNWEVTLILALPMLAAQLCTGCRAEYRDACVPLRLEVSEEAANWFGAVEGIAEAQQAWAYYLPAGFSDNADVVRVELVDEIVEDGEHYAGTYSPVDYEIRLTRSPAWYSIHYKLILQHELGHALSADHHGLTGVMNPEENAGAITQADLDTLDECWK